MRNWLAIDLPDWKRLESEHSTWRFWISEAGTDPEWDAFLQRAHCGQYQQSSRWAAYKASEGWRQQRVIATCEDRIVGGVQILWKPVRLGRIGYVSKGPVVEPEDSVTMQFMLRATQLAAKSFRLTALVVQLPDETTTPNTSLDQMGFVRANPMQVIENTYLMDVRDPPEILLSRMSTSMRRNIRSGRRRNTRIRVGTRDDIALFFDLMAKTCARQQTRPNPPSAEAVRHLWDAFAPIGAIRMTFIECGEAVPAAKLSLVFGDRLTLWKKGWDGTASDHHPNELLEMDSFEWAHSRGLRYCDFCSLGPETTERIVSGQPIIRERLSSRDEYHLRFSGIAKPLSPAHLYIPNRVLRWGFRNIYLPAERRRRERRLLRRNAA